MTHVERAEDRLRPAVGIALDDAQVFANMPPVVGIGTAQAAGPLPRQGHLALALQKAALRFRSRSRKSAMVRGAVSGVSPSNSRAGAQKTRLSVGRCQVKQGAE